MAELCAEIDCDHAKVPAEFKEQLGVLLISTLFALDNQVHWGSSLNRVSKAETGIECQLSFSRWEEREKKQIATTKQNKPESEME